MDFHKIWEVFLIKFRRFESANHVSSSFQKICDLVTIFLGEMKRKHKFYDLFRRIEETFHFVGVLCGIEFLNFVSKVILR